MRETLLGTSLPNEYNIVLGPVWFFLALFWCRIIYRYLAQSTNISQRSLLIIIITVGLVVINRFRPIYQIPYEVTQGLGGMFYYHIGAVLKYRNIKSIKQRISHKAIVISISIIALICTLTYYKINGSNMNLSALQFPLFPIDMLNAVLLVVTLYIAVAWFIKKEWLSRLNGFLAWVGEGSMVIYFIHCIEYHFSIPFMSNISAGLDSGVIRYMIIICNPLIQIIICIVGLYVYNIFKTRMEQH